MLYCRLCHPGPCPSCPVMITKACSCGKTKYPSVIYSFELSDGSCVIITHHLSIVNLKNRTEILHYIMYRAFSMLRLPVNPSPAHSILNFKLFVSCPALSARFVFFFRNDLGYMLHVTCTCTIWDRWGRTLFMELL